MRPTDRGARARVRFLRIRELGRHDYFVGAISDARRTEERLGHAEERLERLAGVSEEGRVAGRQRRLGLFAVRAVSGGNDKYLYIIGGQRLDSNFLSTLVLPAGMRAMLYRNLEPGVCGGEPDRLERPVEQPEKLQPLIEQIRASAAACGRRRSTGMIDAASAETFHAIPLTGPHNELLGVLLVGSSRRELVLLTERIVFIASVGGGRGAAGGTADSAGGFRGGLRGRSRNWPRARAKWPPAAGKRASTCATRMRSGQLGIAFNDMTRTLATQRERLLQTERVAAWRELARRLAHELRNPLFPLQITVENLQRARQLDAKQFLEVFTESTATLKAELDQSQQHRRTLQRFLEDAGAAIRARSTSTRRCATSFGCSSRNSTSWASRSSRRNTS